MELGGLTLPINLHDRLNLYWMLGCVWVWKVCCVCEAIWWTDDLIATWIGSNQQNAARNAWKTKWGKDNLNYIFHYFFLSFWYVQPNIFIAYFSFFFWKKTTFCHFLTLIALVVYWTYIGFNSCSWISSCQRKKITFVQLIHPQDPGDWTFLNAQKTSNNSNSGDIQMTARRLHTAQEQLLIGQTLLDVTIKHFQRAQESVLNFPHVWRL